MSTAVIIAASASITIVPPCRRPAGLFSHSVAGIRIAAVHRPPRSARGRSGDGSRAAGARRAGGVRGPRPESSFQVSWPTTAPAGGSRRYGRASRTRRAPSACSDGAAAAHRRRAGSRVATRRGRSASRPADRGGRPLKAHPAAHVDRLPVGAQGRTGAGGAQQGERELRGRTARRPAPWSRPRTPKAMSARIASVPPPIRPVSFASHADAGISASAVPSPIGRHRAP